MTPPIKELINDISAKESDTLFGYVEAIDEMINYMSHILKWEIESDRNTQEEKITSIIFFKRILEITSSIKHLINAGHVRSCQTSLRSLLETVLQFGFLLKDPNSISEKSLHYFFIDYKRRINELKDFLPESEGYKRIKGDYERGSNLFESIPHSVDLQSTVNELETVIDSDVFVNLRSKYTIVQKNRGNRSDEMKWYYLFDQKIGGLRELSIRMGKYDLYHILYSQWSNYSHGSDLASGNLATNKEGKYVITSIKSFTEDELHKAVLFAITISSYSIEYMYSRFNKEKKQDIFWWIQKYERQYFRKIRGYTL